MLLHAGTWHRHRTSIRGFLRPGRTPERAKKGDTEWKKMMLWWEKQNRKLRSCGARESQGCERQMGEAGASIFSSCLLANALTTRLRPLWLSLFVSPSVSFHFISKHPLSPSLAHISPADIRCTVWHFLITRWKNASLLLDWRATSHPTHGDHTSFRKRVTHTTDALNESVKITTILAAFVFTYRICVGELWVCHIASSPHSRRNYECWIKIFTVHSIS